MLGASHKDLRPAMTELRRSLLTMRTNAPINEREGNQAQAKLERSNAVSYKWALQLLGKAKKGITFKK